MLKAGSFLEEHELHYGAQSCQHYQMLDPLSEVMMIQMRELVRTHLSQVLRIHLSQVRVVCHQHGWNREENEHHRMGNVVGEP